MADALTVQCPECLAPRDTGCSIGYSDQTHQERQRLADLQSLEKGTCALCGRPMVRGAVLGGPVEAWHYDPLDQGCPPFPDPLTDWTGYAALLNQGLTPGHPGIEHFTPADPPTTPEAQ